MSSLEIINILKNDGFIDCDRMVLTNFVVKQNDYILMFGAWFNLETSNYGNERRIFDEKIKLLAEGDDQKMWVLGPLILTHYKKNNKFVKPFFETFDNLQKEKSRLKYDFEAAQKNIMQKFD